MGRIKEGNRGATYAALLALLFRGSRILPTVFAPVSHSSPVRLISKLPGAVGEDTASE